MLPEGFDLGTHKFFVPDALRDPPFAHKFGVLEHEGAVVLLFAKDEPPANPAALLAGGSFDVTTVATAIVTPQRFQDFAAYIDNVAAVLRGDDTAQ